MEPIIGVTMYKLLNKLFGWDYIYWSNWADQGIARVYKAPDGGAYYFRYRSIKVIDVIRKEEQVIWLTCHPSKYMAPEPDVQAAVCKTD